MTAAVAKSCTRRSSGRFGIASTTRSCSIRRRSVPVCRHSRRCSASTSGKNRSAAIWKRSNRPARRSARRDFSTSRCITGVCPTRTRDRSVPWRSAQTTTWRRLKRDDDNFTGRSRRLQRRAAGFLGYNVHLGSRLPIRGAVLMTAFGWLALVPLVLRVVFPWLFSRWAACTHTTGRRRRERVCNWTERTLRRRSDSTRGSRCRRWRASCGASSKTSALAIASSPLVLVDRSRIRSVSTTRTSRPTTAGPAGADAAGRTRERSPRWPTIRACAGCWPPRGSTIGTATWFIGAQRNTCDNAVTFFDEDLVPARQPTALRAGRRGD